MKKLLSIIIYVSLTAGLNGQSNQSYITIEKRIQSNVFLEQVNYMDGLGRPVQTVQKGFTPAKSDLVTYKEYDDFGRESNAWLPVAIASNNGAFADLSKVKANINAVYPNDDAPYSKPVYEMSPLNRIQQQYGPGTDWHNNKKAVKTEYLTNGTGTDDNGALSCRKYSVAGSGLTTKLTYSGSIYDPAQLYVTRMTDENSNKVYEFKDKLGQILLTRSINVLPDKTIQHLNTLYVYDDFGNLCYVIPPEGFDKIKDYSDNSTEMKQYAYIYKYDSRNRCILKRLPGCEPVYYVYDKGDRLIFSQDGEHRVKGEWLFNIPDLLGRVVLTGTCKNTLNYEANPLKNMLVKADRVKATNTYKGYNITGIALTAPVVLTVNYYDNHEFMGYNGIPANTVSYTLNNNKGLLTGTLTAQLIPAGQLATALLYSVMYYDDLGRMTQTKSSDHLPGGLDEETITYNDTGQPTQRKHVHSATGKNTQTEIYTYTYDHAGRLLTTTHQLTDGTTVRAQVILAENTYDELGRLKTNKKGGVANALSTYTYNIRSWTKSITSPMFNQTLYYNESYGGSKAQYNGNISAMSWKTQDENGLLGYSFTYDNLSRLTKATYLGNGSVYPNGYETAYSYDKQGNILTLKRNGKKDASTYAMVDDLTMTYSGNQLVRVNDVVANIDYAPSMDFKNYSNVATEYTYNANGAMNKDLNKGITEIQYNSLNLPRQMDIKSPVAEARNEYTYSAGGQKLKVVQKWNPNYSTTPVIGSAINTAALTQTKTTDYVDNKIYENGTLKRILIDGGYIEGGVYHYYLTDHLGNNRVVVNASGTVIQKNHYYPFGTAFAENTTDEQKKQPYKYNGKELDQMHGLNLYDYSARYYESPVGRFTSVDPLAEKYYSESPYAYVSNNPLKYIDPTGKEKLNGMGTRDGGSSIIQARDKVDNDMIHIYGHGSTNGLTFIDIRGNVSVIKNARDLQSLLTRYSAIWNNRLYGEELTIVLHSCNTGDMYNGITLAENISVYMPNVIIAAPSDFLYVSSAGEIIASENKAKYGYWIYYKEGVPIYSEEGNQDNNPDLKHYNRPSYSKGNTKKEQRAKRDEGLNQGQGKPDEYKNWGNQRRWFYDTFGF